MDRDEVIAAAKRRFENECVSIKEDRAQVERVGGGYWVDAKVFVADPADCNHTTIHSGKCVRCQADITFRGGKVVYPEDSQDFMEDEHSTSCYVEKVNNIEQDTFWVCVPGCPVAARRAAIKKNRKEFGHG